MDPTIAAPGDGLHYRVEGGRSPLGLLGGRTGAGVWGVRTPPIGGWTIAEGCLVAASYHPDAGLAATSSETLYVLDPADGSIRWQRSVPEDTKSGPALTEDRAFVTKWGDGMDLLALDAQSGGVRWRYSLSPTAVSTSEGTFRRWYGLGAVTSEVVVVRERRADPTPGALHAVESTGGRR